MPAPGCAPWWKRLHLAADINGQTHTWTDLKRTTSWPRTENQHSPNRLCWPHQLWDSGCDILPGNRMGMTALPPCAWSTLRPRRDQGTGGQTQIPGAWRLPTIATRDHHGISALDSMGIWHQLTQDSGLCNLRTPGLRLLPWNSGPDSASGRPFTERLRSYERTTVCRVWIRLIKLRAHH